MENNRNIDQFFRERFEKFDVEPPKKGWRDIRDSLDEKKTREKHISSWGKFLAIAASLIIGLFLFDSLFNKGNNNVELVETNKQVADTFKPPQDDDRKTTSVKREQQNNTKNDKTNSSIVSLTDKNNITNENQKAKPNRQKDYDDKTQDKISETLVLQESDLQINSNEIERETLYSVSISPLEMNSPSNSIAFEKVQLFSQRDEEEKFKADLVAEANELEEIYNNRGSKPKTDIKPQKWTVSPSVAAIYLDPNSQGDGIDPQFANNSKSGSTNMGLGVGVHYSISKKIEIRSGINKFAMGYKTNGIGYSVGLSDTPKTPLGNISTTSRNNIRFVTEADKSSVDNPGEKQNMVYEGVLYQQMDYYEIPFEISYNILNRKFGIGVIGGFSTMFLDNNRITLTTEDKKVEIGEANNLEKVNLSTNLGVGFYYKFAKSFKADVNPMVKYQLNTFNANDSTSAFLGLYTGISYNF